MSQDCAHTYLRGHFRPATKLDLYFTLDQDTNTIPAESGSRSTAAQCELSWTVLDLSRTPPSDRCCTRCNPEILSRYPPLRPARCSTENLRIRFPLPYPISQSCFSATTSRYFNIFQCISNIGNIPNEFSSCFRPLYTRSSCSDQRQELEKALDKWLIERQAARSNGRSLMSKRVDMSDAQLKKLADHGGDFLRERIFTPDLICKFVEWDLASPEDLRAVADVIMDWRPDAQLVNGLSPRGGQSKRARATTTPQHPGGRTSRQAAHVQSAIPQPMFSPTRLARGRGGGRGRGRGRGTSTAGHDSEFFGPTTQSIPPRTISTRTTSTLPVPPSVATGTIPPLTSPSNITPIPASSQPSLLVAPRPVPFTQNLHYPPYPNPCQICAIDAAR